MCSGTTNEKYTWKSRRAKLSPSDMHPPSSRTTHNNWESSVNIVPPCNIIDFPCNTYVEVVCALLHNNVCLVCEKRTKWMRI